MIALVNGRVFTIDGKLVPGTVLISGDVITAVGERIEVPKEAKSKIGCFLRYRKF